MLLFMYILYYPELLLLATKYFNSLISEDCALFLSMGSHKLNCESTECTNNQPGIIGMQQRKTYTTYTNTLVHHDPLALDKEKEERKGGTHTPHELLCRG